MKVVVVTITFEAVIKSDTTCKELGERLTEALRGEYGSLMDSHVHCDIKDKEQWKRT